MTTNNSNTNPEETPMSNADSKIENIPVEGGVMHPEQGFVPYADASGLLRGLKYALPVALAFWAVVIGLLWLVFGVIF